MKSYRFTIPALIAFDVVADSPETAVKEADRVAQEIWEEGCSIALPLTNVSDSRAFSTDAPVTSQNLCEVDPDTIPT